jgi:hypothetical protein
MATEFLERSEFIEECYEFLLAYAGEGLPSDRTNAADVHLEGEAASLDSGFPRMTWRLFVTSITDFDPASVIRTAERTGRRRFASGTRQNRLKSRPWMLFTI